MLMGELIQLDWKSLFISYDYVYFEKKFRSFSFILQVLRQMAICWGLGCKRPKPKKEVRPKMGTEGEDIVADEAGGLKLRLPIRFGVGTVKAAAWHVSAPS